MFVPDSYHQDFAARSPLQISEKSRTAYLSNTTSSLIGCMIPILALLYLSIVSWIHRYSQRHLRPLNKVSSVRLQRYAPLLYIYIVLSSLVELALTSWLLLQYRFHHNFPNTRTRTSVRLLLFAACWTTLTAGVYSVLFLHPIWSKHPVSSVGAQTLWVSVTWLIWIVGTALLNSSVPSLLLHVRCSDVVYCGQIQALFGDMHGPFQLRIFTDACVSVAVSVLETLTLTGGMITLIWLAWQSTRGIMHEGTLPRLPKKGASCST
ncbi:hypothetical protein BDZ94DRAFT_1257757 [Collybia nuda]|uniref:Uncharacterized protein n=1 Tax=Collybia nuda TaxID=64659 RepID=A0A9P5Y856_9AGAR|nr:hypothetical protein BDZ94DRAFT_1257757 [Collybia nuda]